MMLDLKSKLRVLRGLSPVSVADNTAQVSQIATNDCPDGLMAAIALGSIADADATFTTLVEHGDAANLSDAAAVPDEYLVGTEAGASFTFADDNEIRTIGYTGPKPYVRVTVTPANNASAAVICIIWIKGLGRKGCNTSQES